MLTFLNSLKSFEKTNSATHALLSDTKFHASQKLPYLQETIIRSFPEYVQFNTHPDNFKFNTSALP